jgi:hypothetical protein
MTGKSTSADGFLKVTFVPNFCVLGASLHGSKTSTHGVKTFRRPMRDWNRAFQHKAPKNFSMEEHENYA